MKSHFESCQINSPSNDIIKILDRSSSLPSSLTLEALYIKQHKSKLNTKDEYRSRTLTLKFWVVMYFYEHPVMYFYEHPVSYVIVMCTLLLCITHERYWLSVLICLILTLSQCVGLFMYWTLYEYYWAVWYCFLMCKNHSILNSWKWSYTSKIFLIKML